MARRDRVISQRRDPDLPAIEEDLGPGQGRQRDPSLPSRLLSGARLRRSLALFPPWRSWATRRGCSRGALAWLGSRPVLVDLIPDHR